jgi:HEPN domain-containing protein
MATSLDLARRLLGAADNDELMARSLLPVDGVTDAGIGFHCQQAVEKALKAVLAAKGIEFPFIHDLEFFGELCKDSGIDVPSALDGAKALTPFAAAERYGSSEPVGLDRDQALSWAASAIEWARGQIEPNERAEEDPGPGS